MHGYLLLQLETPLLQLHNNAVLPFNPILCLVNKIKEYYSAGH